MQKNPFLVTWRMHLLIVFGLVLSAAAPIALAQEAPAKSAISADSAKRLVTPPASGDQWGDSKPPENFVQSKAPSKSDSPYNFIQMAYAALVMLFMAGFIVWLIRRNTRDESSEEA